MTGGAGGLDLSGRFDLDLWVGADRAYSQGLRIVPTDKANRSTRGFD